MVKGLRVKWGSCSRTVSLDDTPRTLACWKDVVAIGCDPGDIIILGAVTQTRISVHSGHTASVRSLTLSSDGVLLASGSDDETVKSWDIQTGGVVRTFCGHTGRVRSVSISLDHTTIASGSDDWTIRLWDTQTGECRHVIDEHRNTVNSVDLSPANSQLLMSASKDHTVQQ